MAGDHDRRVDRPHSGHGIPKHIAADREASADPFKPAKLLQQPPFERLQAGLQQPEPLGRAENPAGMTRNNFQDL